MNENNKQNIELAEIKKDIKYIKEALDRQINSYNGKFLMTDNRITEARVELKTMIDGHCSRIRTAEQKLVGIEPLKKLYDKMSAAALGVMITLGMAVIGFAYTLYERLTKS